MKRLKIPESIRLFRNIAIVVAAKQATQYLLFQLRERLRADETRTIQILLDLYNEAAPPQRQVRFLTAVTRAILCNDNTLIPTPEGEDYADAIELAIRRSLISIASDAERIALIPRIMLRIERIENAG